MNQDGIWLSILEYAAVKKTSISTIRRAIKAGYVKYKEENGKYFIWTREVNASTNLQNEKIDLEIKLELDLLRRKNRELVEEVNDLKMLLSVYENQSHVHLPPIPELEQ